MSIYWSRFYNTKPCDMYAQWEKAIMGKGKRNVTGNGSPNSEDSERPADSGRSEGESSSAGNVPGTVAIEEKQAVTNGTTTKGRSNPPVYVIIGVKANDEGMDCLAVFNTQHQLEKNLQMVKRMSSRHYEYFQYGRVKWIEIE